MIARVLFVIGFIAVWGGLTFLSWWIGPIYVLSGGTAIVSAVHVWRYQRAQRRKGLPP